MENTQETSKKNTGLVEVTFHDNGETITREVYPEVAKFIRTRQEAERHYRAEQRRITRERQAYVWQKEDEYYAREDAEEGMFDAYEVQREWDRTQRLGNTDLSTSALEYRYRDFTHGSSLLPQHRQVATNPNSWAILREEAEAAGHKVVVWIVDNCLEQEPEATIIVKYLPATPEELWEVAKDRHDMCTVFDRFMAQAEDEGVLTEDDIPASLRELRSMRNFITRHYGSNVARTIMPHMKPVIRAEREDAVTRARAEWEQELLNKYAEANDMRELLRSLAESHPLIRTHLNRSDGARRAAETRRQNQTLTFEQGEIETIMQDQ